MGRSDYSTEASSQADGTTYVSGESETRYDGLGIGGGGGGGRRGRQGRRQAVQEGQHLRPQPPTAHGIHRRRPERRFHRRIPDTGHRGTRGILLHSPADTRRAASAQGRHGRFHSARRCREHRVRVLRRIRGRRLPHTVLRAQAGHVIEAVRPRGGSTRIAHRIG